MPQLVVQLEPTANKLTTSITQAVKAAGGDISPMHPGTGDQALARYYAIDVPDPEAAAELAEKLLRLPHVDAAYVKPDDAPPGG